MIVSGFRQNQNIDFMTLTQQFEYVLGHKHQEDNMFADIYYRLFVKLLPKDECEQTLDVWFDEYEKADKSIDSDWWFVEIHKSIRQCDFYGNTTSYYMEYKPDSRITENEFKERNEILKSFQGIDIETRKTFYSEKYKRLDELNKKNHLTKKESISGHLDMILHSLISSDHGFLKNVLENTFEDYKHHLNKKEKGLI